jgi:hypothetical protein
MGGHTRLDLVPIQLDKDPPFNNIVRKGLEAIVLWYFVGASTRGPLLNCPGPVSRSEGAANAGTVGEFKGDVTAEQAMEFGIVEIREITVDVFLPNEEVRYLQLGTWLGYGWRRRQLRWSSWYIVGTTDTNSGGITSFRSSARNVSVCDHCMGAAWDRGGVSGGGVLGQVDVGTESGGVCVGVGGVGLSVGAGTGGVVVSGGEGVINVGLHGGLIRSMGPRATCNNGSHLELLRGNVAFVHGWTRAIVRVDIHVYIVFVLRVIFYVNERSFLVSARLFGGRNGCRKSGRGRRRWRSCC